MFVTGKHFRLRLTFDNKLVQRVEDHTVLSLQTLDLDKNVLQLQTHQLQYIIVVKIFMYHKTHYGRNLRIP